MTPTSRNTNSTPTNPYTAPGNLVLARVFKLARTAEVRGVVAFADPLPRHRGDGTLIPGPLAGSSCMACSPNPVDGGSGADDGELATGRATPRLASRVWPVDAAYVAHEGTGGAKPDSGIRSEGHMRSTDTDDLVDEVSRSVIMKIEPSEADLLAATLADLRRRWRFRAGSLGYGIADAANFVSPYVIAAAAWAGAVTLGEMRAVTEKRIRKLVRRLFREVEPEAALAALTTAADADLESVLTDFIRGLGLDRAPAQEIAQAVVVELAARRNTHE